MEEQKFEEVYAKYKVMVFNICYSYLHSIFDAEDAVQETFIKFYHKDKVFNTAEDEKFYLIRIAINASKDIIKKRIKTVKLDFDVQNIQEYESVDLVEFIQCLKPKYKEIIILKYVEEMSYKEISKMLRIQEAAARKRLQRALNELKEKKGELNGREIEKDKKMHTRVS